MQSFSGRLAGAEFVFATDLRALAGYAASHMQALRADPPQRPAVSSVLRWHEGAPPLRSEVTAALDRCVQLDRDLYAREAELFWFRVDDLRDLLLRLSWGDGLLGVEGDFYFRVGSSPLADRLRRLVWPARVEAMRRRRFTTLIYYMVYYPCWWWLEQTCDLHPIHAAGVELDGNVILLAGASGIGKSTVSVGLAAQPGARFLSDSFVLHRGSEIRAVPEPVLLDQRACTWLGKATAELVALDHRYMLERRGFQFAAGRRAAAGQARLLLFPQRGRQPYVRPLSPRQAHQRLSAADLMINDLRRYFAFAAVMEQLLPGGLVQQREAHLAQLTAEVPSYEFGLSPAMTASEVAQAVGELIEGQGLRAVGEAMRGG